MRNFEFLEPGSVQEASRMLADLGDECRVIAGGTALMLGMRQRMLTPTHLVSLGQLDALRKIEFDPRTGLRIGALALHAQVARSPLVQAHYPMLASMAGRVANPQVRNQGTIGGNLCYADPATDPPGCLMALQAQVVLAGRNGERVLEMEAFLVDYYTTALDPDEIVTEIRIPAPAPDAVGHYARFLRTAAEHRPLASVALLARRAGVTCIEARLAVGASTPIPARLRRAEAFLAGKAVTPDVAAEAADIVAADIDPVSDMRGNADYRREMVRAVARRSIATLFGLAAD
ncbi:FAD binding domain-containing protein [Cupriavidus sp. 8B]